MTIKILLFGVIGDICKTTQMEIENINTSDELVSSMLRKFPEIEKHKYRIAVNQKMISENYTFQDGDEIAFLPPFAGG